MNKFTRAYEVPRMSVIRLDQEDVITISNWNEWEVSDEDTF